jgi:tRNA-specific 2-thiouridylase
MSFQVPVCGTEYLPDAVQVRFDAPQRDITAGQAAVFYQGDLLIGGGLIA